MGGVGISLDAELLRVLDELASGRRASRSAIVEQLLRVALQEDPEARWARIVAEVREEVLVAHGPRLRELEAAAQEAEARLAEARRGREAVEDKIRAAIATLSSPTEAARTLGNLRAEAEALEVVIRALEDEANRAREALEAARRQMYAEAARALAAAAEDLVEAVLERLARQIEHDLKVALNVVQTAWEGPPEALAARLIRHLEGILARGQPGPVQDFYRRKFIGTGGAYLDRESFWRMVIDHDFPLRQELSNLFPTKEEAHVT